MSTSQGRSLTTPTNSQRDTRDTSIRKILEFQTGSDSETHLTTPPALDRQAPSPTAAPDSLRLD
jgi:hypothetical protein